MFAKNNRGQVTVFIILGLVLLFAVTAYLILNDQNSVVLDGSELTTNLDFIEVQEHVQYCLNTMTENAVVTNGLKGGLYNPSEFVYGFIRPPITKFYKSGDVISPSKEQVAYSIGLEFLDIMPSCLNDFIGTTENLTFDAESASVTVRIVEGEIAFSGEYPVTSTKEDKAFTFSRFSHTVEDVRLFTILDLATELSYVQQSEPGFICVTCVLEMADQNFMYIDFTDIGGNNTVYTFTDLFSSIDGEPYVFLMSHEQ